MKELVEFIAKSLVDSKSNIVVTMREEGNNVFIKLHVDKDDMGKVIGKKGRIAKAIRTVVKSAGLRENKRVIVDIED